jgi:holin-like protein
LLFIPVGVGVILHLDVLQSIWWQIAVALLVSTILGLVATVMLLRLLIKEPLEAERAGQETGHD